MTHTLREFFSSYSHARYIPLDTDADILFLGTHNIGLLIKELAIERNRKEQMNTAAWQNYADAIDIFRRLFALAKPKPPYRSILDYNWFQNADAVVAVHQGHICEKRRDVLYKGAIGTVDVLGFAFEVYTKRNFVFGNERRCNPRKSTMYTRHAFVLHPWEYLYLRSHPRFLRAFITIGMAHQPRFLSKEYANAILLADTPR